MRKRSASALLLFALACTEAPPPAPPDAGFVIREDLSLRWKAGLPMLPRTSTVPPSYAEAAAEWRTATTAFSYGNYDAASRAFVAAAAALEAEPSQAGLARTLRAGRCMAYENAARAFRGATDPEEGVVALAKARARDAACQHSITRVLDRLSTRSSTTAGASPETPAQPSAP